jgi:NRPS condensation-like uncharacterized protein
MLVSLLIWSIHDGMKVRDEKYPVSVRIPVNLRKYFSTGSARNFICVFDTVHNFSKQGRKFEDVLANVKETFKNKLSSEMLLGEFNRYTSFEHAPYIKVLPLGLKVIALKTLLSHEKSKTSATFSNIGSIAMPKEMSRYIRLFSLFCSNERLYVGVSSFLDITSISFLSPFVNTSVQRSFFRTLSGFDLDVELVSNTQELQEDDNVVL